MNEKEKAVLMHRREFEKAITILINNSIEEKTEFKGLGGIYDARLIGLGAAKRGENP